MRPEKTSPSLRTSAAEQSPVMLGPLYNSIVVRMGFPIMAVFREHRIHITYTHPCIYTGRQITGAGFIHVRSKEIKKSPSFLSANPGTIRRGMTEHAT